MSVEELAQELLELRQEDRDALERAASIEVEAFEAFASEYLAIMPCCTSCHTN